MALSADLSYQDVLYDLLQTSGGPGDEEAISAKLRTLFSVYSDDIRTDALGNLIVKVAGEGLGRRPRILLGAHMDEISLLVSAIEPGGFLRLAQTGSFDARTLVGQEVLVHGKESLVGVVGSKPPHLTTAKERLQAAPLEDLFVDVAMPHATVVQCITIGDRVTVRQTPKPLLNNRFFGKSLDNRTSLTILLECLQSLRGLKHTADVFVVATTQEEVGLRGAAAAAYSLRPDIAIAVDVTWADMPGQPADLSFRMGDGPVIVFGPNIHPKVFQALKQTAIEHNVPWQMELSQDPTSTDGAAFQIAGDGIATGVLGIAIRYMHTSVETGSYQDILQTARLLAHFIAEVDAKLVEGLTCY